MKILVLTFGKSDCASTWYRILQYQELFQKDGIDIICEEARSFDNFASIPSYNIVILQKTILSSFKTKKISRLAKKFIYDADDLIWTRSIKPYGFLTRMRINYRMHCISMKAEVCTVANNIIANELKAFGAKTKIIKMGLNGELWTIDKNKSSIVNVGWTGAPSNIPFIEALLPVIQQLQKKELPMKFLIHCGKDPKWNSVNYEYIPFEKGMEPKALSLFDIGLLPLPVDRFSNGKSPIKALQYLATQTVMVTTPCAATKEFAKVCFYADNPTAWAIYIEKLVTNNLLLKQYAAKGKTFFDQNYNFLKRYKELKQCLIS